MECLFLIAISVKNSRCGLRTFADIELPPCLSTAKKEVTGGKNLILSNCVFFIDWMMEKCRKRAPDKFHQFMGFFGSLFSGWLWLAIFAQQTPNMRAMCDTFHKHVLYLSKFSTKMSATEKSAIATATFHWQQQNQNTQTNEYSKFCTLSGPNSIQ